jgi:hypothetical protein
VLKGMCVYCNIAAVPKKNNSEELKNVNTFSTKFCSKEEWSV